jgi:hypothetical protein
VIAGVVVDVATDVVNSGDRFPADTEVTVPLPPPPPHAAPASVIAVDVLHATQCPGVIVPV